LPKLPSILEKNPLPELPQKEEESNEKELPSFPESDFGRDFSQEAIKSAILPKSPPIRERMTIELPSQEFQKSESNYGEFKEEPLEPISRLSKKAEPVYIRIDKFKSAITNFEEIRSKIIEIDRLLKSIQEQKRKEDEELRAWETDIELIKTRVEAIDKNIFSKIE